MLYAWGARDSGETFPHQRCLYEILDTLVKEVRVKPVYNEQEPEGFILTNIESTSVLKEIGLRIGDMITGINGQKIAARG
ncbi:MAG: hypothetical protein R2860_15430 [Desulfobacterales bacterium]